jgi:hypothetical protein
MEKSSPYALEPSLILEVLMSACLLPLPARSKLSKAKKINLFSKAVVLCFAFRL